MRGLAARPRPLVALALAALLAGCSAAPDAAPLPEPRAAATGIPTSAATEPDLDLAVSKPLEDSVYPAVGDPGVDALHYDLDLTWEPGPRRFSGVATITFRATRDARRFRLDLVRELAVSEAVLDGHRVPTRQTAGDELVVRAPVERDGRHELVVTYAGMPTTVPAPTQRSDFSTLGLTVAPTGELWTMQEPYGAHTWYPVNDHPSDKALYDFTVHAPDPWTGVANGRLVSLETAEGTTTTHWQLDEPAASYLTTLAIGDYAHSSGTTRSGLRVDHWLPRGMVSDTRGVRGAAEAVDWIESRLGPYPFTSLGLVVTASDSAMETQTMVTLGTGEYVLSQAVVVHELVHQWYGDQVSPADWRDVWLNEGMTMLLQWMWQDEHEDQPLAAAIREHRAIDGWLREEYGPPGNYDPTKFGGSNIYYSPALMWNELRTELGDEEFFRIARSWLAAHDNTSVTREQVFDHWEKETGRELSAFFDAWINGVRTPRRGVPG